MDEKGPNLVKDALLETLGFFLMTVVLAIGIFAIGYLVVGYVY